MIYFDNSASSYPKPPTVINEVCSFIRHNGANPGRSSHKPAITAAEKIYETRETIARFFGVSNAENVVFVPNATYGLNMVIQGVVNSGDEIVITDLEHNSVIRPVHNLFVNKGIKYKIAKTDLYNDRVTVENIANCITNKTKLVVCTQCSNTCGKVLPIKEIANILPVNVKFLVDGSQGAGSVAINLEKYGVDYYCAPSHKGLMGIQGSGFLAINSTLPKPIMFGGTGSDSNNLLMPGYLPDALESGTLATPAIISMKKGIDFINSVGIEKIYNHKVNLTRILDFKLKQLENAITYTDCKKNDFCGVYCFNLKSKPCWEIAQFLSENDICVRSGIHCSPLFHKKIGTQNTGAVRISFGWYNSEYEIEKFTKILYKIL